MKTSLYIIIFLVGMASACGKNNVQVSLLDACLPANGGKDVTTSGYLGDKEGSGVLCTNPGADRMTCGYAVLTDPDGEKVFSAFVDQGNSKNQAEKPPSGYKKEDIKIRDDKGSVISLSDKVKLTGKMTTFDSGRGCVMAVDKIER